MEIRAIRDDEVPAYRACMIETFGGDPATDPIGAERMRALLDLSRAFAAFDGGRLVATSGTFDFTLAVPGGTLPMAGLTMVTVRPTHRRRGLLRLLIDAHLAAARRAGQPVSGLWASDAGIYGRFGYGVAAWGDELTVDARGLAVALPPADGDGEAGEASEVTIVDDDEALRAMPAIYERLAATRAGLFSRTAAWWKYRRILDRPEARGDQSPRRHALVRRGGHDVAYVAYRQKLAWADGGVPSGAVVIDELVAVDAPAEASLWRFLCALDLFPKVSWWNAPGDTVLPWLVADARRVKRQPVDTLWLRIDDVAATLAARRYAVDGEVRLAVEDADGATTTVRLHVERGAATCTPDDAAPSLRLTRAALGALYLGGTSPTVLARAGHVRGAADAVALVARMFATASAPWCAEVF